MRKIASQALSEIESGAGFKIPVLGRVNLPGVVAGAIELAPQAIPQAIAAGGAGAALTKGVKSAFARFAINTAVQTAIFNGPDAVKTALVNQDPVLAAENLLKNGILNAGFKYSRWCCWGCI